MSPSFSEFSGHFRNFFIPTVSNQTCLSNLRSQENHYLLVFCMLVRKKFRKMLDVINAVLSIDSASKYAVGCCIRVFPKKEIKVPNKENMILNLFLISFFGNFIRWDVRIVTLTVFSLRKSTLCGEDPYLPAFHNAAPECGYPSRPRERWGCQEPQVQLLASGLWSHQHDDPAMQGATNPAMGWGMVDNSSGWGATDPWWTTLAQESWRCHLWCPITSHLTLLTSPSQTLSLMPQCHVSIMDPFAILRFPLDIQVSCSVPQKFPPFFFSFPVSSLLPCTSPLLPSVAQWCLSHVSASQWQRLIDPGNFWCMWDSKWILGGGSVTAPLPLSLLVEPIHPPIHPFSLWA